MSHLSGALKAHIGKLNITIQSLSKSSGVERSFLHHILTGKRIPANKDILENIIKALALTPAQSEELRQLYSIDRLGSDVYRRILSVKNIIENFKDVSSPPIKSVYQHNFSCFSQSTAFSGSQNVNTVLKAVLENEATKENGYIKMIIQPDYRFLLELLQTLGSCNTVLKIEHIFCFSKDFRENNENTYNLKCLETVIPLLFSCRHYNAHIYYGEINTSYQNICVFPYMVLTSDKVVGLSPDYSQATLFLDHKFHSIYMQTYQNLLSCCFPLTEKILNPLDVFTRYSNPVMNPEELSNINVTHSLYSQPCFMYFATQELLNKYISEIPFKREIIGFILRQRSNYIEKLAVDFEYCSYFTKAGLDFFWKTGRIVELPDAFYTPLDKKDCLKLIKLLYENIKTTSYRAHIINTDKFHVSGNIVVSALEGSYIVFIYTHLLSGDKYHLVFDEPSISSSFSSFLTYLKDSTLVYTEQKTLEILNERIIEYEKELTEQTL
ncbi:hypothetical protein acsn021_43130 [Anaerocolumna cellulosilytica]|uniref:Uncharacterized protein n=1 Tax=Anaerocolumna cellulosilytica TaxID=433286 RepID=A0A6S6R1G8_9FIRM|nr:helix-turn-helix transcriptional regulator [Anaerocolumna cellulosilytica]MBB5195271.1 hypothetical protein [Anaerocolumna cellulosilytica]BCJ96744.1 hypothetical protein acsn021_43130 [Anaerocolumna cellulosilytica]